MVEMQKHYSIHRFTKRIRWHLAGFPVCDRGSHYQQMELCLQVGILQPEVGTFHFRPGAICLSFIPNLKGMLLLSWEHKLLGSQTSGTDVKSVSHESHHFVKFILCFYLVKVMTLYDILHGRNSLVSHHFQVVTKVWSSLQQDLVPISAKFTWRIEFGVTALEAWGPGCLACPLTHT